MKFQRKEKPLGPLEVNVDGSIEKAMSRLKRLMASEGVPKELKKRRFHEKPSERRKRKSRDAERRRRRQARRDTHTGR